MFANSIPQTDRMCVRRRFSFASCTVYTQSVRAEEAHSHFQLSVQTHTPDAIQMAETSAPRLLINKHRGECSHLYFDVSQLQCALRSSHSFSAILLYAPVHIDIGYVLTFFNLS